MNDTFDVLDELEQTGSRISKEAILKANSCDKILQRAILFSLDPYRTWGVKPPKKLPVPCEADDDVAAFDDFLTFIDDKLAQRVLTGNAAKHALNVELAKLSARGQKWAVRVLLQNLRIGVDTTANKVWPGLIPKFKVGLAETLDVQLTTTGDIVKIRGRIEYPVRVEPKLDGLRLVAIKTGGIVKLFTRNGTELPNLPRIRAALEAATFDDVVLDGEVMADGAGTEAWNESASVVMSRVDHKDDSNIFYNVFDSMTYDEWIAQRCDTPLGERCAETRRLLATADDKVVRQVKGIIVKSEEELLAAYVSFLDEDYEGCMIKVMSAPYVFKRSEYVLKLKPFVTHEGTIVGWFEGRRNTRHEGGFGGIEVLLPNGAITRVGSGFKDHERAEFMVEGPESLIGRIAECKCQPPLTKDGIMRFPTFVRFRDEADVDPGVIDAFLAWSENQGEK